jgi:type IV pilus biogenesis protein CpaD/CtpE
MNPYSRLLQLVTMERTLMKNLTVLLAATVIAAACAQQTETRQGNLSAGGEPPSRFQSIGSCEPTAWVGLQNDAERLPPDQRLRVKMMLDNAQSYYADDNRGQCILVLQNAEKTVRQYNPSS